MKQIVIGGFAFALLLQNAAVTRADQTLSPNSAAAYFTTSSAAVITGYAPVGSVLINKGKKKHVLQVDAMLTNKLGAGTAIGVVALVNGVAMEHGPGTPATAPCPSPYIGCTVTAQFWVDIDTLELMFPGGFVRQPLHVDVYAKSSSVPITAAVTARARLIKK